MPPHIKILRNPPQSLMRLPQQFSLFLGSPMQIRSPSLHSAQFPSMAFHQPVNLINKPPSPFNAVLTPFQIPLRLIRKQHIKPPSIDPILLCHIDSPNDIPLGLRHSRPALQHHPLRKQPSKSE